MHKKIIQIWKISQDMWTWKKNNSKLEKQIQSKQLFWVSYYSKNMNKIEGFRQNCWVFVPLFSQILVFHDKQKINKKYETQYPINNNLCMCKNSAESRKYPVWSKPSKAWASHFCQERLEANVGCKSMY